MHKRSIKSLSDIKKQAIEKIVPVPVGWQDPKEINWLSANHKIIDEEFLRLLSMAEFEGKQWEMITTLIPFEVRKKYVTDWHKNEDEK